MLEELSGFQTTLENKCLLQAFCSHQPQVSDKAHFYRISILHTHVVLMPSAGNTPSVKPLVGFHSNPAAHTLRFYFALCPYLTANLPLSSHQRKRQGIFKSIMHGFITDIQGKRRKIKLL